MPKYADTIVTSKLGINFVKTAVESAGCIFHKIDQDNERALVEANRKLIEVFEKKIQAKLAEIWGEE